jgi:hypothetical protein
MMGLGEQLIILLCLFLIVWYVIALIYNRRLGLRTLTWLQEGLPTLGDEIGVGWIGSANSGARATIQEGRQPFRQLELVFLLESRELLPLWLADLLRGKRDQLAIKATLRSRPQGGIEIVPAASRLARELRAERKGWSWTDGPHALIIGRRGEVRERLATLTPFLELYGPYLRRISWRSKDPHLFLLADLGGIRRQQQPASHLFEHLQAAFADG